MDDLNHDLARTFDRVVEDLIKQRDHFNREASYWQERCKRFEKKCQKLAQWRRKLLSAPKLKVLNQ